jgi:hypothetical protein
MGSSIMSLPNTDRNFRSIRGNGFPAEHVRGSPAQFAELIANALQVEFGQGHGALKAVCRHTGAHERAVKNWFAAKNGPSGYYLMALMRISEVVLEVILLTAGRRDLVTAKKFADSKRELRRLLSILVQLQNEKAMDFGLDRLSPTAVLSLRREASMVDPADVIKTAIHSSFVKYPMEDDPDFNPHWIKAEECAHLTKVILAELEANGMKIVKKSG